MFYYDENGFLSSAAKSVGFTETQPAINLKLPRLIDGVWQEGIVRRAAIFDEQGFHTGYQAEIDPRTMANFTIVPIPNHLILPRFINNQWTEGAINFVAIIDGDGFFTGVQANVDPRALTNKQILHFPPTDFMVPKLVDGEWKDIGIPVAALLDADGYLTGYVERIDPRTISTPFTTTLPDNNFIVPRFIDDIWTEAGIEHAWKIDADGYFISDLFDIDPRTTDERYTCIPLESNRYRKPRLVSDQWIEANPITDDEILAEARREKSVMIEQMQNRALTNGVAFRFGDVDDIIQTRNERDLINISGVTTRAILLQSQGVEDPVIQFRAESNTTYLLTPSDAIELGQTVAMHSEEIYNKGWTLKDQLAQTEDLEDIEAIVW